MEGFKGHADGQGRGDQTVAKLAVMTMTSQWQRPGWTEWTSFGYVKSTVFGHLGMQGALAIMHLCTSCHLHNFVWYMAGSKGPRESRRPDAHSFCAISVE